MKSTITLQAKHVTGLAAILLWCILGQVHSLSDGPYPGYDPLCITAAPAIPAPWDCRGYIRCEAPPGGGGAPRAVWTNCPSGQLFDPQGGICSAGYTGCLSAQEAANRYCRDFPSLVFVHPGSCSLFYNCSQASSTGSLKAYEGECPYPELFDGATLTCVPRPASTLNDVCGGRSIPQTSCGYKVGCSPSQRCEGLPDGDHTDPSRPFSQHYVVCQNGSVVKEAMCNRTAQIFDPNLRGCTFGVRDDSISEYCNTTPSAIFPDPYHCARYFDCSQTTWQSGLREKQSECKYPLLFDVNTTTCTSFDVVSCGIREEPIQPCDYIIGHCLDRPECIPCQASCLGLPDGYSAYPGYVLTAYHIMCDTGRTVDIRNCSTGLVFDPQTRTCSSEISLLTLDLFCADNPNGKLAHPSECSLLYDCTRLTAKPNFPQYVSECKYPYLVDAATVQCKPHDQVDCGERREPISPCDYLGYKCTSSACKSCELVMPSCYGKLNGFYPVLNQEMTSSYMECRDQRVVALSSCPGGLIFDMVDRKCVDTITEVSMLQFCTNFLTGRVQSPSNCAQYYDCTKNLTAVQECRYPDLYHVQSRQCRHYSEVECDSFTFCPVSPCPYCPTAFPTCIGRNGAINGFIFDEKLYYRCIDNRMILGRCQTFFDRDTKRCNESATPVTSPPTTAPKGDNCAQFYNCSNPHSRLGAYVSECPIGQLFDAARGHCAPRHTIMCGRRYEPLQACDYKLAQCPPGTAGRSCAPCSERFPDCRTIASGPHPLPLRLSTVYIRCRYRRVQGVFECPPGKFFDPMYKSCKSELSMNTTMHFCMNHPNTLSSHPLHCARYILCRGMGTPPVEGECDYPNLFANGRCLHFNNVQCGRRHEPKAPYRFPSCEGLPDGFRPYPGKMFTPLFVKCNTERTLAVVRCVNSLFDPVTRKCGQTLTQILINVARDPVNFCRQYPDAIVADPLHCARYFNCSQKHPGLLGRPHLSECRYPSLFNRDTMQCDSFVTVLKTVGCGHSKQPIHQCEYSAYCPGTRYQTCSDCYRHIPSCRHQADGIHTLPPGRLLSQGFVYCLDQRALVYSDCPSGYLYYDAAKTCVARNSLGSVPALPIGAVTEAPEVK
ncbi:hypothetical protein BaRGS_00035898 [Batillaria attramentaria]|uniref:Chitin-binding type-2 domain-containing protein n=1 Tax=Batillaria attramentaria TaxID=370345 RepID=A0ABD0JE38_9CAEN